MRSAGNEVEFTGDKRKDAKLFKNLATRRSFSLNRKHIRQTTVRDTISYYLTSNTGDLRLDNTYRRFFIHRVERAMEHTTGSRIAAWFRSVDGKAALLWHLGHVALKGFDPKRPAPMTAAKAEMTRAGDSGVEDRMRDWADNALEDGREGEPSHHEIITVDEALSRYHPEGRKGTTPTAIANALRRAGWKQCKRAERGRVGATRRARVCDPQSGPLDGRRPRNLEGGHRCAAVAAGGGEILRWDRLGQQWAGPEFSLYLLLFYTFVPLSH